MLRIKDLKKKLVFLEQRGVRNGRISPTPGRQVAHLIGVSAQSYSGYKGSGTIPGEREEQLAATFGFAASWQSWRDGTSEEFEAQYFAQHVALFEGSIRAQQESTSTSLTAQAVMHADRKIRDYIYIDQKRVYSFLLQLGMGSLGRSGRREPALVHGNDIAIIDSDINRLLAQLDETGRLSHERPNKMAWDMPPFVIEQTLATKLILPSKHLLKIYGIRDIGVWVSDPEASTLALRTRRFDWFATFLYLVELHFDDGVFQTVYSGCSALQMIYNAATGAPLLKRRAGEPLGRYSSDHPTQKLCSIGASMGDPRQIEVLYRPRYMTDEQCYIDNGKELRVNDLLGYPLYIAEVV